MTQEDRELLLKDLCTRLPYGVKVYNTTFKEPTVQTLYGKISDDEFLMEETYTSVGVDDDDFGSFNKRHYTGYIDFIKPYLRPLSLMTQEECRQLFMLLPSYYCVFQDRINVTTLGGKILPEHIEIITDFYNSHHLDFRYLIPQGLALEAPEGMYNFKD